MYVAVIEPHPALLGPFAIFSFLLQSFRSFCGDIGNGITNNYVRSWPRQRAAIMPSPSTAPPACSMLLANTRLSLLWSAHSLSWPRRSQMSRSCSAAANFIGTIGASMLLLRPFLHMNRGRGSAMHVAFFIFTVGNLGGAVLPVGPPTFSRLY